MHKTPLYILISLLTLHSALAIVIDQVYYDPIGTESGGEFIILRNDADTPYSLADHVIATGSSATDVTLPDVLISPEETYLIADIGWNASKDNPEWPEADLEDTITLKNTDSGVAIVYNGTIIDAVGWGNSPEGLFEGEPANTTKAGEALIRHNDTNDNSRDFTAGEPVFTYSQSGNIQVSVIVLDPIAEITEIAILSDDDTKEGVQLMPHPGDTRSVTLRTHIKSPQNITATAYLTDLVNLTYISKTGDIQEFTGTLPLNYYQAPGTYTLTVTADNGNDVAVSTIDIEILPLIGLSVDIEELDFGSMLAGETKRVTNKTLKNIGNVPLDLSYQGTPLRAGPFTINSTNLQFTVDKDFAPASTKPITPQQRTLGQSIDTLETLPLGFEIYIPQDAIGGSYTGTIMLVGVSP